MSPLLRLFLEKKTQFISLIWIGFTVMMVSIPISWASPFRPLWPQLGEKAGSLAAGFFCLSLWPGILKRFQVTGFLQHIEVVARAYRRQIGLAAFFTALNHYVWVKLFPLLLYQVTLLPTSTHEVMGYLSIFMLLPLALTSNDLSRRLLEIRWYWLHKLVYIIVWTIMFHLVFLGRFSSTTILVLFTAIAESISQIREFAENKHQELSPDLTNTT